MTLGKSIRVYLKEGNVTGIKFAELVNQTIQALSCPRKKLVDLSNHFSAEINKQGVYFLFGHEEETTYPKVYIGEAENVWKRLKSHDLKKDFWNDVIIFTSKDDNLTKSHIKYLENRIVEIAKENERYYIANENTPTLSSLPLPDKDAMEEFLSNIKLLTGTLGHRFLESTIPTDKSKEINPPYTTKIDGHLNTESTDNLELYLNTKDIKANAILTDEGLVVLKGSDVSSNSTKNYGYGALRDRLITDGVIQKNEKGGLSFTKKHLFTSTSSAAAVIVGYSINGRNVWKNKEGKSIKEIEKSEVTTNS